MNYITHTLNGILKVVIEGEQDNFRYQINVVFDNNIYMVKVIGTSCQANIPKPLSIHFDYPGIELHSMWSPNIDFERGLRPDWFRSNKEQLRSDIASGAPIVSFINYGNQNKLTVAFSDALNLIIRSVGMSEETSKLTVKLNLFSEPMAPIKKYEGVLRIDTRDIPYYEAINDVQEWWCTFPGYEPISVPNVAKKPLYSTWYSYHQMLDVESMIKQCELSRKMGFGSIIIDDGWQTDDNSRGYKYCGDWHIEKNKIPDITDFVRRVHALDMKIMFWFSVPFVGCYSKVWEEFKGKYLNPDRDDWRVLDPRFPEVRSFLIQTYKDAILNWDLDGLKLDFIDDFTHTLCTDFAMDTGRDYQSVPEAVDRLMKDIVKVLIAIKSDIMLEFRQSYIGPLMRTYGNIFRASDCPNDTLTNRVRTIDIRLLCGDTITHSDMIMWSDEDTTISACMQIIHTLFSVPQISVLIDDIGVEHSKMLEYWMRFWIENSDVLIEGKLMPLHPEANYSIVLAEKDEKLICAAYGNQLVPIDIDSYLEIILVNGMYKDKLIMDISGKPTIFDFTINNCSGERIDQGKLELKEGIQSFNVPPAGVINFKRWE